MPVQSKQHSKQHFDLAALLQRIPSDSAEFFVGYSPSDGDLPDWKRSTRERLLETPERAVARTIWEGKEPDIRLLIDATECSSAEEAMRSLAERVESNQLAILEDGPAGIGDAAISHPAGAPPAIFFVRGNLCLTVASFGRRAVPVLAWAQRIDDRLSERPATRNGLTLATDAKEGSAGREMALTYTTPGSPGPDAYARLTAVGLRVEFTLREGRVFVRTGAPGGLHLEVFVLDPGRESWRGTLNIVVR